MVFVLAGLFAVGGILGAILIPDPSGRWAVLAIFLAFALLIALLGLTLRAYVDLDNGVITCFNGLGKKKTFSVKEIANVRFPGNGAVGFYDGKGKILGSMLLSRKNHSQELLAYFTAQGIPFFNQR